MNRIERIAFIIVVLSFAIGFVLYPQMPYWMVSHWNINGVPDGFMHKFWGLFLIPLVSMVVFIIFQYIPLYSISNSLEEFRKYYDEFLLALIAFFFVLHLSSIFWNLGVRFMIGSIIAVAFAGLFYYLSVAVEHAKQNYFFGIRTPWTLRDKRVWDKTHLLAGPVYRSVAVVAAIGALIPHYALYFMIVPVLIASIYLVGYSYREYKQLRHKKTFLIDVCFQRFLHPGGESL